MREDLLGYLLGALDDDERAKVEQALESDPQLRQELERLKTQLEPLGDVAEPFEPPAGLADRTCAWVAAHHELENNERLPDEERYELNRAPELVGDSGSRWSMADLAVAAGIFIAVSMLFFPSIANSRYTARLVDCQNNLRELGYALTRYSELNGGNFPYVPVEGNRAFAGLYGPILVENQLIDRKNLLCPDSELAMQLGDWSFPQLDEIDRATGQQLLRLQRLAGGSYGSNVGLVLNGRYVPLPNDARADYPLMADAPSLHLEGRQTANHGGKSQNVLFQDGHVANIVNLSQQLPDNPLVNRHGKVEAGVDVDDAVIAPSPTPPLRQPSQGLGW